MDLKLLSLDWIQEQAEFMRSNSLYSLALGSGLLWNACGSAGGDYDNGTW